jgi:hypothetical protein
MPFMDVPATTAMHSGAGRLASGPAGLASGPAGLASGPADLLSGPALHLIAAAAAVYRATNGPLARSAGTISGSTRQAAAC